MRHYVELTNNENNLLKAAVMALMGGLMNDRATTTVGALGFRGFLAELGQEGFENLVKKMDAHDKASRVTGEIVVEPVSEGN